MYSSNKVRLSFKMTNFDKCRKNVLYFLSFSPDKCLYLIKQKNTKHILVFNYRVRITFSSLPVVLFNFYQLCAHVNELLLMEGVSLSCGLYYQGIIYLQYNKYWNKMCFLHVYTHPLAYTINISLSIYIAF